MNLEELKKQAAALSEEIISCRRQIHQNPEAGTNLPETQKFVMEKLTEYGYEPKAIAGSGVTATLIGDTKGKTILLRADMDALPITEQSGLPFASANGSMHACGHDMHTAMLLGAAKLLMENRDQIKGTVKLAFQPDEEGFTGAKAMLKAGILENPKVDAGIALHVHSGTPSGMVLCGKGTCMAGCTLFRIHVKGRGCHGAMPETGIDPINIAAHIYTALQEIVAREVGALTPLVVTIGKFSAGEAPNIIPEEAVLEGTIRSLDKELSEKTLERINDIALSVGKAFRGQVEVTEIASAPPLINDEAMVDEIAGYVRELNGPDTVVVYQGGGMGSEDFASYTYEIPSAYLLIGAGSPGENPLYGKPMHNDHVVFNEEILQKGAAIHAYSAISWLKNHQEA